MADVFVSYAREDRVRAEQVANALTGMGLDVFWDSEIPPGTTWADYIEDKLSKCKVVVVLWSAVSTKSQWVREEARMGRDRGTLIPASLDNSVAPFGFGEVQAANLSTWTGAADHPEWRRFSDAVRNAAGAPARPTPPKFVPGGQPQAPPPPPQPHAPAQPQSGWSTPPRAPEPEKKKGGPNLLLIGGGVVAVGIIAVFAMMASNSSNGGQQNFAATTIATTTPGPQPSAGARPNPQLPAAYGAYQLAGGFQPDPQTMDLQAGGPVDAAQAIGGPCRGFIAEAPDVALTYSPGSLPLAISVNSQADTALVVMGPNGNWFCDDDGGNAGLNPAVVFSPPMPGTYYIWVATYTGGQLQPATLGVSETNSF